MKIVVIMMDEHLHTDKLIAAFSKNPDVSLKFIFWNDDNLLETAKGSDGIIISGSHWRILNNNTPRLPKFLLKLNKPILGICYGFQWIANELCKEKRKCISSFENGKLNVYNKMLKLETPFIV